jgi:uncharacterized protein
LASELQGIILSGTNLDDMDDFRPGLRAAERFGVRHPFVECSVDKTSIRRIADTLGYRDLAQLPAAPCLSSRVETGLRIDPQVLGFVDRVESALRGALQPTVVRCRIRLGEIAIQLDEDRLAALSDGESDYWRRHIGDLAGSVGLPAKVRFEHYRMGSAFVPQR